MSLDNIALPTLKEIYKNKNNTITRRAMAWYAIYKMDTERYDLRFNTPNGKYTIKCSDCSVIDLLKNHVGISYYNISIVDETTKSVTLKLNQKHYEIQVQYLKGNKYAVVSHTYNYAIFGVLDLQNAKYIGLPSQNEVESALGKKLTYTSSNGTKYNNVLYRFQQGSSETEIKVNIYLMNELKGGYYAGWYTYDLINRKITDSHFEVIPVIVVYPDSIVSQISWCYDVMLMDNFYYPELTLAKEYSDEFTSIIDMGEKVFPVLDEIMKISNITDGRYSGLHVEQSIALTNYIKYTMNPESYDVIYTSPDKKYALK